MQELIPLNKLQLSASNVRKSINQDADEQLSHDIEARGLLQNLIVTKAKKRGHYDVVAGGRRLRAMARIVERGAWQADHTVPCMLLAASETEIAETSLAENFQRLAMTPAEECRAFQHFISQEEDTTAVAKRFGVTRRFVEGRLRLAALAEPIFEALASGDLSLEMAKAYASTDQHAVQLRVFEQARYHGENPDYIRRLIANGATRGTDPIALLVGEEAYTAAGGRIERDLFSEAADDRWIDLEILQGLAAAKLEAEAARLSEETGLGTIWPVAGTTCWNASRELGLTRVILPPAPISNEAQARIDAIEARVEEICSEMEDCDEESEELAKLQDEYETLERELDDLSNPQSELPDAWKAEVGRFLLITTKGEMVLDSDYFSEKELRMVRDEEGAITGGSFVDTSRPVAAPAKPSAPEATAPGGKAYSARLFDELAVQRRNVLAASLLSDPGLALDYAIFALADATTHSLGNRGTTIRAGRPQDPVLDSTVPKSTADDIVADAFEGLDKGWSEHESVVDRFMAFRDLGDEAKMAWVAYTVATSLEAKLGYASGYNPIHAQLGMLLDIDTATLWRPTGRNYFDRISKGSLLDLLKEVGGSDFSARYAGSKKADISESCEKLFAGEAIVEEAVKQRALSWVPAAMRFDLAIAASEDTLDEDDGDGPDDIETDDLGSDDTDPAEADDIDHDDVEPDPSVNDELEDALSELEADEATLAA
ncbi:ParB/RepB/Spo0J family partition protein [Novosphingobium soli]|uniref:ParB/RepB/Spo0J family partition protein n=1 Tax=Novosphingobium soli TaxID=574956 RepID=A0ABV6CXA8_9SPHN